MDGLIRIWGDLTLGPISIFSALFMLGMLAFIMMAGRNVRFMWGIYLAAAVALTRAPVVWYKRELRGDPEIVSFVVTVTIGTFLALAAAWPLLRLMYRGRK